MLNISFHLLLVEYPFLVYFAKGATVWFGYGILNVLLSYKCLMFKF